MSREVSWMLELAIAEGKGEDFRQLAAEMVRATEANEPQTLSDEWSVSADGRQCHIYERYADSAAVMKHLGSFGRDFAMRFWGIVKPVRVVVYGSPDATVQEALGRFEPVYMKSAGGFTR